MAVQQWECYVNKTEAAALTLQFSENDRLPTEMHTPSGTHRATKTRQKLKIFKEKKAIVHDYPTERNYAIHLRMSEWCAVTDSKGPQTTKLSSM